MRLLTLLTLGLLASRVLAAESSDRTVDLGAGNSVILTLPAGWTMSSATVPGELASISQTVQIVPSAGANAIGMVTFFVASDDRLSDQAALRDMLTSADQSMAPKSVEGKVDVHEFKVPSGAGYSATFTDSSLVGKPSEPGNYKVAISVLLYLPGHVVVNATLLVDDAKGADANALFALLRSISPRSKTGAI